MRPDKIVRIQQVLEVIALSAGLASTILIYAIKVMPWVLEQTETIGFKLNRGSHK